MKINQIHDLLSEVSKINKRLDKAFIPKQSEPIEVLTIKPANKFKINKVEP